MCSTRLGSSHLVETAILAFDSSTATVRNPQLTSASNVRNPRRDWSNIAGLLLGVLRGRNFLFPLCHPMGDVQPANNPAVFGRCNQFLAHDRNVAIFGNVALKAGLPTGDVNRASHSRPLLGSILSAMAMFR